MSTREHAELIAQARGRAWEASGKSYKAGYADAMRELGQPVDETPDAAYREQAKALFNEEGVLEVRDDAPVHREADGAYVQAWLWIAREAVTGA